MSAIMCKKGCYNITTGEGQCPESCEHGAWNDFQKGICGAECLECGGDLFLTADNKVYCDACGYVEEEEGDD